MSAERNRRGRPKGTGIDDRMQLQRVAALMAGDPDLKPTTAIKSIGVNDPSIIRRLRDKFHEARHELMADVATPAAGTKRETPAASVAVPTPVIARDKTAIIARRDKAEAARAIPARINSQAVRKSATAEAQPTKASAKPVAAAPAAPQTKAEAPAPAASARTKTDPAANATATTKSAAAPTAASTTAAPAAPSSPPVSATHANADPASWLFTMCGFGIMAASAALEAQAAWASQLVRLPPMAMALRQHIALNELAMTMVTPSAVTRASFH